MPRTPRFHRNDYPIGRPATQSNFTRCRNEGSQTWHWVCPEGIARCGYWVGADDQEVEVDNNDSTDGRTCATCDRVYRALPPTSERTAA